MEYRVADLDQCVYATGGTSANVHTTAAKYSHAACQEYAARDVDAHYPADADSHIHATATADCHADAHALPRPRAPRYSHADGNWRAHGHERGNDGHHHEPRPP